MLEKPANLQDEQIVTCLREAYGLTITDIVFLPLGAGTRGKLKATRLVV